MCVKAEEEFNVLAEKISRAFSQRLHKTHAHGICKRAEHVTKEKVAEFYRVKTGKEKTPLL